MSDFFPREDSIGGPPPEMKPIIPRFVETTEGADPDEQPGPTVDNYELSAAEAGWSYLLELQEKIFVQTTPTAEYENYPLFEVTSGQPCLVYCSRGQILQWNVSAFRRKKIRKDGKLIEGRIMKPAACTRTPYGNKIVLADDRPVLLFNFIREFRPENYTTGEHAELVQACKAQAEIDEQLWVEQCAALEKQNANLRAQRSERAAPGSTLARGIAEALAELGLAGKAKGAK